MYAQQSIITAHPLTPLLGIANAFNLVNGHTSIQTKCCGI